MIRFVIALSSVFWVSISQAQDLYCYSADKGFLVATPKGFIRDEAAGKKHGVCAFFYPKGFTFDSAPVVLYPNFKTKQDPKESVRDMVERDSAGFLQNPAMKVTREAPHKTRAGTWEVLKLENGPAPTEFEKLAYVDAGSSSFLLVLSARKSENLKKYSPAFVSAIWSTEAVAKGLVWSELALEAEHDKAQKGGKEFHDAFVKSVGSLMQSSLTACLRKKTKGQMELVFQISDGGNVKDVFAKSPGAAVDCMRGKLIGHQGPKAPRSPFHIKLDLTID